MSTSLRPFDVITVPDFTSGSGAVFEARTLVFLASWIERAGTARNFPLHLACIGQPPASVRRLAGRCGASITVHEPLQLRHDHPVGNKFRGLEIVPRTDRFLLLDVDVTILSDPAPLSALGDCVAACPDDGPNVTLDEWRRIHSACGMRPPELVQPLFSELDLPRFPRRIMGVNPGDRQCDAMMPYFNGGVVFAPWACDLRRRWAENVVRIAGLFDESQGRRRWIHHSDQAGLAVTLETLRLEGWAVRRLPDAFNTRWLHLYAGSPAPEAIAVMHCCWNFLDSIGDGPVDADTVATAIDRFFHHKMAHRFKKFILGDLLRLRPLQALCRYRGGRRRAAEVCAVLIAACQTHLAANVADADERHTALTAPVAQAA